MKINTPRDPDLLTASNRIKEQYVSISRDFINEKKSLRETCPACGHGDFEFAFRKETFHYVRCLRCHSLFVLNVPVARAYDEYRKRIDAEIHSTEQYADYLRADSENILYDIELSLSRFINLRDPKTAGFFGKKNSPIFRGHDGIFRDAELIDFSRKKTYDIVIINNEIESILDVGDFVSAIDGVTRGGSHVYLTARNGSGIDVLTLWDDSFVIPLQHMNLFSVEGFKFVFSRHFDVVDISTPGSFDLLNITQSGSGNIPRFIAYMMRERGEQTFDDFQSFIQKNLLSSYIVIILKKKEMK